ncbi:protein SCAI isoform X3 [Andrena cerasifolii]|uniref:protein SCAI isoform X3 n=1 Tax=Andrena cerasifolii TaxID=2819439 RepID=UPI004037F737
MFGPRAWVRAPCDEWTANTVRASERCTHDTTILDTKYGLKRWQIGEIASKIGQLYYHYYLRTSETSYLHEAYSFYAAIRGRAYYSRAAKEDRSDLMVKKLRYYARFIVVCLLLNRMKLVRELVQELDAQIADYTSTYEPDDQLEWNLVLDEIKAFVKAESAVGVVHSDSNPVILTHRLGPQTSPPVERTPPMCLSLQEILIVGNCADQVKFSELSMDMFRMLQTLEREPRDDPNHLHDASPAGRMPFRPGPYPGAENGAPRRDNPHKYLLYKPTYSQVQVFLASGFKELPVNGALLLYLSADGCFSTVKHPEEMGYDLGGVSTCSKRDPEHGKRPTGGKEPHCLYPGDLYPFTRKPLFVVVDSDNSFVFQQIPRYFGQPLMVLMSPQDTPPTLRDVRHGGSLFTLFLHAPLAAFCLICNIGSLAVHHWERCQRYIERFLIEACQLVMHSRCGVDSRGPVAIHRCRTSSSIPASTTWCSTWPPASTVATTSRTATSSPDPGTFPARGPSSRRPCCRRTPTTTTITITVTTIATIKSLR